MKKMYLFAVAFLLISTVFAFMAFKETIVGKWKITYSSGNVTTIIFRSNGTVRAEIPAEHFIVEGKYKMQDNILLVTDTSCGNGYWGKYKPTFFSNDSAYAEVIEDSCSGRRYTVDKQTLIRIKD
jgi:hypothetical protein